MDEVTLIVLAAVTFLCAGTIKGLVGLGLPTASMAVMTLWIDPRAAIALVLFPMLGSNLWQIYRQGDTLRTLQRYLPFAICLCLGVLITTYLTTSVNERVLMFVLGFAILLFVAVQWRMKLPPLPTRYDRTAQILFGGLGGVIGGLTAGWAAPLAMYLQVRGVDKEEFVRATGVLIALGTLPLIAGYLQAGLLTGQGVIISCAMLIPTLVGFAVGENLRKLMSGEGFKTAVLLVFFLLALNLLRRAIWGG